MQIACVLFSLLLSVAWGINVTSVTYSTHSVQIDSGNNFRAAIFSFTFDEDIMFVKTSSGILYNQTEIIATAPLRNYEICFPPLQCITAPNITINTMGLLTLSCPSETINNYPSNFDGATNPPTYFMMFGGSSKDLLLNFFAQTQLLRETFSSYITQIDPRMLHAIVLLSYTQNGEPYLLGGKIRNIEPELSQCTFELGYHSIGFVFSPPEKAQVFQTTVSGIKPAGQLTCGYFPSVGISTAIVTLISNMSNAANWNELQQLRFENALLENSDAIVACQSLISTYMAYTTKLVTFSNTTDCLRDLSDPFYGSDPCCNTTLQFFQCCAASKKSIAMQVLKSADTSHINCHNFDQSSSLLYDYVVNSNSATDPVTGCQATAGTVANNALIDKYTDFIQTCLLLIYGAEFVPPTCTSDADCLTYCTSISNTCFVDWYNPDDDMLKCHRKLIDPQLITLLKTEWELPYTTTDDQFWEVYKQKMSSENCVGPTAPLYTWRLGAQGDMEWVTNNEAGCLADYSCNYDYTLDQEECILGQSACTFNSTFGVYYLYLNENCYLPYIEQGTCEYYGGVWDNSQLEQVYSCVLPNTTRDECLPDYLCPPRVGDYFLEIQCTDPFCYDLSKSEENCTMQCGSYPFYNWTTNVAAGPGLCQVLLWSEDECENANGTWWAGREYAHKSFYDTETCDNNNVCYVDGFAYFADNCSDEVCTEACHACGSQVNDGYSFCYLLNMTDCSCVENGGTYDAIDNLCLFPYTPEDCDKLQYLWASCQVLTKEQCDACEAQNETCLPPFSFLNCSYAWGIDCESEKICSSVGGRCNDPFFNYNAPCDPSVAFPPADCEGVCMHDFSVYAGVGTCPTYEYHTYSGCIAMNISSQAECETLPGYYWQKSFTNKEDCEAPKMCVKGQSVTFQSEQDCLECGGTYESIYTWYPGETTPGKKLPLQVVTSAWLPTNTWAQTLDFKIIEDTVNRVVAENFALALQTEAMCLYNPLLEVITHIACDCINDPSAPTNCYLEGTRIISVGVQRFFAGNPDSVKAGPVKLTMYANSISVASPYLDVNIDITSASQFRKEQTLSINVLSASTNPYAILQNSHEVVVGQLVGDGVILLFNPSNFAGVQTLGDPNFKLQSPTQVCIQLRPDISHSDKDFPIPDFATPSADYKTWTFMETPVNFTSDGYCFNLLQQGTYFPILRTADWANTKNKPFVDNKVVLAFIYIFGIVFVCLSFVSAFQIWVAVRNVIRYKKLNLALFLFSFMFLFNMVRGLYLLIFPSGRLEHNQGAKYFLSEAPQFFFFSVYSVIIFLWAELSVMVTAHKSFLYHFKWPFILTNVGLYTLFIVSVSIYHSLSPSHQSQLQKAYVYILAICCLVAVVAFNAIGRKLIKIQLQANKTKTNLQNRATLERMVITIIVSSITLIGQIVFLFVVTYSTVSQGLALMAYVITEVLPSATLLFTLRPLSQKATEPVSSTESKNENELQ